MYDMTECISFSLCLYHLPQLNIPWLITSPDMSLASTLLGDLSSDEGSEAEDIQIHNSNDNKQTDTVDALIKNEDLTGTYGLQMDKYAPILELLQHLVVELKSEENFSKLANRPDLIRKANETLEESRDSIRSIYTFIKIRYKPIWPDLDTLIPNPINFAKVIVVVKGGIDTVSSKNEQLSTFLKKDEILGLSVSASSTVESSTEQRDSEILQVIVPACKLLIKFSDAISIVETFLTKAAHLLTPNVTAIVGPQVSAQLLATLGLDGLIKTPACNLPNFGANDSATNAHATKVKKGFIYYCELVQSVSADYKKQAMRQISAKVVLAARIDYSQSGSERDDKFGKKWHDEVATKLEKLQAPPDNHQIKPLPKPVDKKSSRRAGRRFRKQKEKMRMSKLEEAKNKMPFYKAEDTQMDAFGNEIGLGMASKFASSKGAYTNLTITESHRPHITKGLAQKLDRFLSPNTTHHESKLISLLGTTNGTQPVNIEKKEVLERPAKIRKIEDSQNIK